MAYYAMLLKVKWNGVLSTVEKPLKQMSCFHSFSKLILTTITLSSCVSYEVRCLSHCCNEPTNSFPLGHCFIVGLKYVQAAVIRQSNIYLPQNSSLLTQWMLGVLPISFCFKWAHIPYFTLCLIVNSVARTHWWSFNPVNLSSAIWQQLLLRLIRGVFFLHTP